MEPSDLRWLAGLLEGEGTFLRPVPSAPRAPLIRLAMTDHDVVRRAAGLLERSVVSAEGGRVHGHRTVFMVTVKGAPAISWMRVLRPYLSTTRRAQVDRSLACSQVAPRQTPIEPAEAAFAAELVAGDGPCDEDWLAGLLEGEAWFGVASTGQHHYPCIKLEMCNEEVVRRAADLLGVHRIWHRRDQRGITRGWNETFGVSVRGARAATLMRGLRGRMGQRRMASIDRALAAYTPHRLVDPPDDCIVIACGEPHKARGLCHKHYMTWSRDRRAGKAARIRALR